MRVKPVSKAEKCYGTLYRRVTNLYPAIHKAYLGRAYPELDSLDFIEDQVQDPLYEVGGLR